MKDSEAIHESNRLAHDYIVIYRKIAEENRDATPTECESLEDIIKALKIENMNFYQAALYCKRYIDLYHMTRASCSVEWCRPRGTIST